MGRKLGAIGCVLILGLWGMCLFGGTSGVLGLLATDWYVVRFTPAEIDTIRTGLLVRGIGAAIGLLLGLLGGVMCSPKPLAGPLLRGTVCGTLTATALGIPFVCLCGGASPVPMIGCGAIIGGTFVMAKRHVLLAVMGGPFLMATAGAIVGPADGWIVLWCIIYGVCGLVLSPLVLLVCYCFILCRPCDATDGPEEAGSNAPFLTPDRFVGGMVVTCITLFIGTQTVLGAWQVGLASRYAIDYVEDSPQRYLVIQPGRSSVTFMRPENHPRTGKILREVNGDLETVFREMYRGHPRYVVETSRPVAYRIVFDSDDPEVPEIVARELGLRISTKRREADSLVLRVAKSGCNLQHGTPSDDSNRDPDGRIHWEVGRTMEGISMEQLAEHLETKHNHPVVNMTSLKGHWTVTRSDQALHDIPGRRNENAPAGKPKIVRRLGDSGIELQWEKMSIDVLVIEDCDSEEAPQTTAGQPEL